MLSILKQCTQNRLWTINILSYKLSQANTLGLNLQLFFRIYYFDLNKWVITETFTTAVYLQGDLENLQKLESGLDIFCKRLNAMINWHKSCIIWLSHDAHPAWHPDPAFKWINQGESTKYLGFQIGFNIPPKTMITPVIRSI